MGKDDKTEVLVILVLLLVAGGYYLLRVNPCALPWMACVIPASSFKMVGIFAIVLVPCPANVQCNPQYQLAGTDGNTYQLLFLSSAAPPLPTQGQRIEVKGTVSYNTMASCILNGQATPCQPIGTVIVSSWNPA